MNSYILVAAAASVQLNHVAANGQPPARLPRSEPARLPRRLEGNPACCVEHSYWANGEVMATTCYGGRSPWDAATMTDLCTAGYSEAGEVAPPFRDCRQEAIDSGNCGTGDWDTCAECVDHNVGSYFANVGYASCPDWVVDAMNAEGAAGGQCAAWTLGYENACREWGYPKEGEWNVDEDCCAGKKQMACADGYRLENTGNVCYDEDCTAYDYHCIACDPASSCMGNLDEDGEDYFCDSHLILVICLPIGVVLICIGVGCCICHRRRQAQQRQAQAAANAQMAHVQMAPAAANAQMAHVQMAPVPKSYAYNTQQRAEEMYNQIATWYNAPENAALRARWGAFPDPDEFQTWPGFVAVTNAFLDQGAIVGEQQPVLEGVVVPSAPPIEPKAEEMYNQIAAWYNAPENAALRATWGAYPEPAEFQTWPGFVAVTNAYLDREEG